MTRQHPQELELLSTQAQTPHLRQSRAQSAPEQGLPADHEQPTDIIPACSSPSSVLAMLSNIDTTDWQVRHNIMYDTCRWFAHSCDVQR